MTEDQEKNLQPAINYNFLDTIVSSFVYITGIPHLIFWALFYLIIGKIFKPHQYDKISHFTARIMAWHVGYRLKIIGKDNIIKNKPYVFVINHVNRFDIFATYASIPGFYRSFEDITHFKMFIYGQLIKSVGQVPVSRNDKTITDEGFRKAVEMLKNNFSFAVFPEGHRTVDGSVGKFYPGAFKLAIEASVPIIPVVQKGSRKLARKGDWRLRPGAVEFIIGTPITTEGLTPDDVDSLKDKVRTIMIQMLK